MSRKYSPRTAPDPKERGWPKGIGHIIGNEGCERFSFYGMRAILYVYVVGLYLNYRGLHGADGRAEAVETVHLFNAAVYALPMIGALISDRLLGKYRTILTLSIVYCMGHAALALFERPGWQQELFGMVLVSPITGLYIGLGLIAVGSGGIKPCVSAHVGDQFGPGNWRLLQKVYNGFYFIINFGSAFATILIPIVRGKEIVDPLTGYISYTGNVSLAFGIPGILMGLATFFFWLGRKKFVHVPANNPGRTGLLDVLSGTALFLAFIGYPVFLQKHLGLHWSLDVAICAGLVLLFWMLFSWRQRIQVDDGFFAVTFHALRSFFSGGARRDTTPGDPDLGVGAFWRPSVRRFGVEAAEGPPAVLKIVSIFIFVSVFWALFDQHSSTWIAQAKTMDRVIDMGLHAWVFTGLGLGLVVGGAFALTLGRRGATRSAWLAAGLAVGAGAGYLAALEGPIELAPSQIPAINPFLVMILIPYTSFGLYPLLRKLGLEPTPLRRMTAGMFVAALSFAAVAVLQSAIDGMDGGQIHVVWQVIPYGILTLAEVMVSVTGLEFAYSQAPRRMKSVIMGFWLLTVTLGNLLVAFLAGFKDLEPVKFFWVFAGLMAAAGLLFAIRAAFYQTRDFTQ